MFDFKLQMWLFMVVRDADGEIFSPHLRMHTLTSYQSSGFFLLGGLDEYDSPQAALFWVDGCFTGEY